jgi:hypothetical protein
MPHFTPVSRASPGPLHITPLVVFLLFPISDKAILKRHPELIVCNVASFGVFEDKIREVWKSRGYFTVTASLLSEPVIRYAVENQGTKRPRRKDVDAVQREQPTFPRSRDPTVSLVNQPRSPPIPRSIWSLLWHDAFQLAGFIQASHMRGLWGYKM